MSSAIAAVATAMACLILSSACSTEPASPLTGVVTERSGAGLSGVTVTLAAHGGATTSATDGTFSLVPDAVASDILRFDREGYGSRSIAVVVDGAGATAASRLVAQAAAITVDAASGGTFDSEGLGIVIGPGVFEAADGSLVIGPVSLAITRVLRVVDAMAAVGPVTGSGGVIEAVAAFDVAVSRESSALKFRAAAGLRVDVKPLVVGAEEVPVWRLDLGSASLVSAGTATLDAATGAYAVTVDGTGLWVLGAQAPTTCVSGRVTSDGAAVPGAWVAATGAGRATASGVSAGSDGRFCLPVGSGGEVTLSATLTTGATVTKKVMPGTAPVTSLPLTTCSGCLDVGDLE